MAIKFTHEMANKMIQEALEAREKANNPQVPGGSPFDRLKQVFQQQKDKMMP